ncbi:MAG: hypothetical protein JWN94_4499 [Betaproteobacteria bacterium]|nr:hypothetical protein [Betaproteobacteria bacterium]
MNTRFSSLLLVLCCAGLLGSTPAAAVLYKWVDERGVTNYSSELPPGGRGANKVTQVENKMSVYTPDANFMQAVKVMRERSLRTLAEPEAPRPPGMQVERIAVQQSGYEQCLASGRLGCDDLWGAHYPYYSVGAPYFPYYRVPARRFLTPRPTPHVGRMGHIRR